MNAKQAARAAAKRIDELEYINKRNRSDIVSYNRCIDSLIAGGSACGWCEDREECQREGKYTIRGCDEWMLAMSFGEEVQRDDDGGNTGDVPETIPASGFIRGAGD